MDGRKNNRIIKGLIVSAILVFVLTIIALPNEVNAQASSIWGVFTGSVINAVAFPLAWLTRTALWLSALILAIFDSILTLSIEFGVVNFADKVAGSNSFIVTGWEVMRDIANMLFLFIILWIGISIILGVNKGNPTSSIVKIVLAALLINFSMFFAKFIIDIANVLALHFYNLVIYAKGGGENSLGGVFMQGFNLQSIYKPLSMDQSANELSNVKIIFTSIIGIVMILIAAWIFLAAAIMLVVRTIYLMILIMISPIAFISWITPELKSYTSKWWNALFKHAFYAPAFMVMIYIVAFAVQQNNNILNNNSGGQTENTTTSKVVDKGDLGVVEVLSPFIDSPETPPTPGFGQIFFNFGILIGLMIGAMITASKVSAFGSTSVIKWGQKFGMDRINSLKKVPGGVAGGAIGGLANKFENSKFGESLRSSKFFGQTGRLALRGAQGLQKQSIFGGKSYKEQKEGGTLFKTGTKERLADLKEFQNDPTKMAKYFSNLGSKEQRSLYTDELSARSRAALEQEAKKTNNQTLLNALNSHKQELSIEDREKVDKEFKDAEDREKARIRTTALKNNTKLFDDANIMQAFLDPNLRQRMVGSTAIPGYGATPVRSGAKAPVKVRDAFADPGKLQEILSNIQSNEERKQLEASLDKNLDEFFADIQSSIGRLQGEKDVKKLSDAVEKHPELITMLTSGQLARLNGAETTLSNNAIKAIVAIIKDPSKKYANKTDHMELINNPISKVNWGAGA